MSHDLGLEVMNTRVDTIRKKQSKMKRMYFIHNSIHFIFHPVKVVTGPMFVEETLKKIFSSCVFGCVCWCFRPLSFLFISLGSVWFSSVGAVFNLGRFDLGAPLKKEKRKKENGRCFFFYPQSYGWNSIEIKSLGVGHFSNNRDTIQSLQGICKVIPEPLSIYRYL